MKIKFDDNFSFGAATSGPQTEGSQGKKNLSIYDEWFSKSPSDFWGQIGPTINTNTYKNYENDIELMEKVGLNSFRTSIQWTRLIKNFETYEIDSDGLKFYKDYFQKIKDKGIELIVNLHHFDMPQILFEKGGFLNRDFAYEFAKYAKICFQSFGKIVDKFTTFNEPVASSESQYLYGLHIPFEKDFTKFINVVNNTMLAHSLAVKEFRQVFKGDQKKEIGIILNLTPVYPKDNSKENIEAANLRDLIFNQLFLDIAIKGKYSEKLLDFLTDNNVEINLDEENLKIYSDGIIDFLGINYYQPCRISVSHNKENQKPWNWFEHYEWEERRINPYRGWEIFPKAVYDIAIRIKNEFKNIKWFIAENGIGVEDEKRFKSRDGKIEDDYRIDFYKEHLYWLNKAIKEGANCFGYHVWTFIDCWSWANSFKNRYGLIELDLETQVRTIKKSGFWFKELSETKEFEIDLIPE